MRKPFMHSSLHPQDYGVVPELTSVMLLGDPDWEACQELASGLVKSLEPCSKGPQSTCPPSDMPKLPKVHGLTSLACACVSTSGSQFP